MRMFRGAYYKNKLEAGRGGGALTSDQVFIGTNEGCLMESLP